MLAAWTAVRTLVRDGDPDRCDRHRVVVEHRGRDRRRADAHLAVLRGPPPAADLAERRAQFRQAADTAAGPVDEPGRSGNRALTWSDDSSARIERPVAVRAAGSRIPTSVTSVTECPGGFSLARYSVSGPCSIPRWAVALEAGKAGPGSVDRAVPAVLIADTRSRSRTRRPPVPTAARRAGGPRTRPLRVRSTIRTSSTGPTRGRGPSRRPKPGPVGRPAVGARPVHAGGPGPLRRSARLNPLRRCGGICPVYRTPSAGRYRAAAVEGIQ